ncbi:MAG: HD-GYP domain-containing protein [Rhodocyclaceae bacterium]|nr:HD-GYP domain-containing protein [Rhodocyclaceae bacterium]MCA3091829.1 HD-GYP domain-containing protein [Rhodocyclaceae bacterium]MCA3093277.1 HD-GYP domain-containing protein [Rhodocyclaceae bacterium]MCA3100044.1 HD-GYP domain-containing protein [Rhodocyclaceae bacterium]MCA3101459.1 HD-GYP domain-containing protein [Rhodocyclaceae bacterium]
MLKRISVSQLRVGMHVHELCGSWLDHPFWRTRFLVKEARDIDRLLDGGVQEVWIDTSKGADVPGTVGGEPPAPHESTSQRVDADRACAADVRTPGRATMGAELERAARICENARSAMISMFSEARMGEAIDSAGALELVDEINASVERNPGALISLARLKTVDDYTFMHSIAVCGLMLSLGRQLGLEDRQLRDAGLAGLLHDLGKAVVPASVLNKPGKLTDAEFDLVKKHPQLGHAILIEAGTVGEIALDVCLHHHERVDGTGYPHGLEGSAISLYAKMGTVCDIYDAITSNRPYKTGWNPAESIRQMAGWSKGHFDERVFHAFVKSVGIYPVGSLVRMASGRLGVVTEQNEGGLTTPRVKLFFSIGADARIPPEIIDLSHKGMVDRIIGREDPEKWDFRDLDTMWAGSSDITPPPKAA